MTKKKSNWMRGFVIPPRETDKQRQEREMFEAMKENKRK